MLLAPCGVDTAFYNQPTSCNSGCILSVARFSDPRKNVELLLEAYIVLLEAMACGLPVVSTRCGGPEAAVVRGRNGFLVPVGNAEALARALAELISNPNAARRMSLAAREDVVAHFPMSQASSVFLCEYQKVLSTNPQF